MQAKWPITKVEEDSPERCHGVYPGAGQCCNKQVPGSKFCPRHGGNKGVEAQEKETLRIYAFHKFQNRVTQFADHPKHKDLSMELALMRQLLEGYVNRCADLNELLAYAPHISDTITRIEKLVNTIHKIDKALGSMLDKAAVLQVVSEILTIISDNIDDEETLNNIAAAVGGLIERVGQSIDA